MAQEYGRIVNFTSDGARAGEVRQDSIKGPGAAEAMLKRIVANYPLGKLGQPENVANAVVFLASDRAVT